MNKELRRVLIGTPSIDGKVDVWFTDSLIESTKLALSNNINLIPVMLTYDGISSMAKNELIYFAYTEEVESLVFIDSNQAWDPSALLEIINSPHDVIGLPVTSKTDEPGNFNVNLQNSENLERDDNGYIKVQSIGMGFLKLSKKALTSLWNSNPSINFHGKELKIICEYLTNYNSFLEEDITLCNKLKELDYDIWVNPNSTCAQTGKKVWMGNYAHFLDYITSQQPEIIKE